MKSITCVVIFTFFLHMCYGSNYGGGGHRRSGSTSSWSSSTTGTGGYSSTSSSPLFTSPPGTPVNGATGYQQQASSSLCTLSNILDSDRDGYVGPADLNAIRSKTLWTQGLSGPEQSQINRAVTMGGDVSGYEVFRKVIDVSQFTRGLYTESSLYLVFGFNANLARRILNGSPTRTSAEVAAFLRNPSLFVNQ